MNTVYVEYSLDNEWRAGHVARLARRLGLRVKEKHVPGRHVFLVTYRGTTVYDLQSAVYLLLEG